MEDDVPTEDLNDPTPPTPVKQKLKKLPTDCKICGASAIYSYFGAVVCSSCKIFFRRNANMRQNHSKCHYDGYCEINILTRHVCSSCRLAKCFANGMQADLIRASRTAKSCTNPTEERTTISTVSLRPTEKDQLPTLNLLRSDQSTLTLDQWNLLSNLTHCYDEYSTFSLAERFMQEQNELPPKMRFRLAQITELFTSIASAGQLLYEKNADFVSLCSHDRSLLLRNTLRYVTGLGGCFIMRHTRLLDEPALYKSLEVIYGTISVSSNHRAVDQLDFDSTFFKLVLALLTFSTYNYTCYTNMPPDNLINIKAILRIQNMYTELIWRYLLYKYDHEQAVICFLKLLRCLFLVHDAVVGVNDCQQYTDMIDSLIKQTEETLTTTE